MHHSDRGSQYLSIRYGERPAETSIEASVGSQGDSYYSALAETTNGLCNAEVIHGAGRGKSGRRWNRRRWNGELDSTITD